MAHKQTKYLKTKRGRISKNMAQTKYEAKQHKIPFNLDLDYLVSIATDCCPVFKTKFEWEREGAMTDAVPTLDRVIPELGYVKGNVVFISFLANKIKQDKTEVELYAVADWLHDKRKEVLNARQEQHAPVPNEHTGKGETDPQSGAVHGAGTGQDCDGSHHHRGEREGENASCGTKESCRICMGSGVRQMEALNLYVSRKDYGLTEGEIQSLKQLFGCVCC